MVALNHRSALSKLPRSRICCAIASRFASASGETSTRKAMFRPELLFRLLQRYAFPAFKLIDATFDCRQRFGTLQTFEHNLVAFRVLNNEFGSAVNRKDEWSFILLQSTNVVLDV